MIFHQQEMSVNISITSFTKSTNTIINKYFPNQKKQIGKDEIFEGAWNVNVINSSISNDLFYEFLLELTKHKNDFDVIVNSNGKLYVYESFSHIAGQNYIIKNYLPEKYLTTDKNYHCINVLCNLQEEKIELQFN